MRPSSWCFVLGSSALVACQPPAPAASTVSDDPAAARAAINEANARGIAAVNSRDRAAYVAQYAEEATIMNLGEPDYVGLPAFDSALASAWALPRNAGVTGTWKADSIEVHGDYAYEVGSGMFIRPAAGARTAPDTIRNRYITFWRKGSDGKWRITRDFTANVPRPTK